MALLERPTPLDLSNLRVEVHGRPLNVAALAVLEQQALLDSSRELELDAIRARIEQRLHLAPRLRQRLYWPGFGFGGPVWVDDASFEISRHVRTRPAPAPGGEESLLARCVELNDGPFDQAHPLLLASRGELRPELVLKVPVAASVRAPASASQAGNLVGVLLAPLPVGEEDPIRRLEQIARATAERKRVPPYQPASRFLLSWMIRA